MDWFIQKTIVKQVFNGKKLKKVREAKGVTQAALAKRVGLSSPFISDLERGMRFAGHDVARKIIKALR